jgi:hypothetical protein
MEANEVEAAAREIAAQPPEKKTRKKKPAAAATTEAQQPEVQQVVVTFSGVEAKDVSKAVSALLSKLSQKTKTEAPTVDEVDAISAGIATGLQHTKIAVDPNTGPWVPLGLAALAYALPRIIDVVMRAKPQEAAPSGTFREDVAERRASIPNETGA